MRSLKWLVLIIVVLAVAYLLGPHPATPVYTATLPTVPRLPVKLEEYVHLNETKREVKPGNNAMIVWADSMRSKTPYSIVYLHGFSASREEGNPVHTDMAKEFACNLYLSRLAEHGLADAEPLLHLTADNLWESAKEALSIGKQLGEKVILVGTSTGGSLALQLAATYPEVAGVVLLSPNIEINNSKAAILNNPWGLQVARMVRGSDYNQANNKTALYKKYWYYTYRLEGAIELQEYLETAMLPQTFKKVTQPVLALYYYKDDQHQDPVVKVSAIHRMIKELGTPDSLKKEVAIPNAGNHVLGSYVVSKDIAGVERAIRSFLQHQMHLNSTP